MENPFIVIEQRLSTIETLLVDLKNKPVAPGKESEDEVGGVELARKITGYSTPTIYSLVSNRKIPHSKQGKKLFFSKKELIAWINSGKRSSVSELTQLAKSRTAA